MFLRKRFKDTLLKRDLAVPFSSKPELKKKKEKILVIIFLLCCYFFIFLWCIKSHPNVQLLFFSPSVLLLDFLDFPFESVFEINVLDQSIFSSIIVTAMSSCLTDRATFTTHLRMQVASSYDYAFCIYQRLTD